MDISLRKLWKMVKDRETRWAAVSPWGHKQSDTTKRLNNNQATDSVPILPEASVLPHRFTNTRWHPHPTPSRNQFQVHVVICALDQLAVQPPHWLWFKLLEWLRETFDLADHQFIIKGYNPGTDRRERCTGREKSGVSTHHTFQALTNPEAHHLVIQIFKVLNLRSSPWLFPFSEVAGQGWKFQLYPHPLSGDQPILRLSRGTTRSHHQISIHSKGAPHRKRS